jgi:poly(A) polymerase
MSELGPPRLSPEFLDYHAVGMVKHLQKGGFTAYLVGGCVRDLLAGHMPKDFDIGTNALPQEVKKLLSFAFIIGRRFRLVLVKREDKQYEVATFRREPHEGEFPEGVPFGDNIFGTPQQDAFRRDFTCNALFYDPVASEVIDHVNGQRDIQDHMIRMIGDPKIRLAEDPIRILRALRFAHKLHFRIEPALRHQMSELADCLALSVLPRRREEFMKLLRLHDPAATFREGFDLNLWTKIAPELHKVYEKDEHVDLLEERLRRLDSRLMDPSDTALLSGTLVLGWLRASSHKDPDDLIKTSDLHQNEHLEKLAKEQLGLHNWELGRIIKALSLQKLLSAPDEFQRRGGRRRNAVLFSEAFPLAVDLAHIDAVLDPEVLEYWDAQLSIAAEQIQDAPPPRTHRPAHQRRQRKARGKMPPRPR